MTVIEGGWFPLQDVPRHRRHAGRVGLGRSSQRSPGRRCWKAVIVGWPGMSAPAQGLVLWKVAYRKRPVRIRPRPRAEASPRDWSRPGARLSR